ncbi:zinc transporter 2 isoform X3 [Nilaparvata lugens]|uniref:zinc transporter 2 isoform X3 n=1 Tax=Nilaparvata lugens TaxID=108931 RepID=UPI00193CD992|nr:zinc transporter 2 isoform X3 [Nilaparvata lugens]
MSAQEIPIPPSTPNLITYSVSFCDNSFMVDANDREPLLANQTSNHSSQETLDRGITLPIPKSTKNRFTDCHCANSFPSLRGAYHDQRFGDPALYGSLPGEMDCLGSDAGLANGSSSNKQQKVIFCVHGKPSGCCVTRLQTDPTSPTETITLDTEDHCHKMRQDSVDKVARRKLIIASILCVFFMIAEVIGGVMSNSLAIATDAAHLLTDFASFMISLFALWVAARKPTRQLLFGWHRAEVIGALCSVLTIWVVTGILVYVAVERIIHQQYEIDSTIMLVTSAIGVLVNLIMGCTLHQHSHGHGGAEEHRGSNSINVRAAFIHVLGDFIQSTGVFIASILIYFNGPSWYIIDPICTFLFSILVMITTFTILKDTMLVLMEGMPRGVEYGDVLDTLLSIQHVEKVHNLRIWALSLDKTALAAHIVISPNVSTHDILKAASKKIHSKFNFFEMTLQIEYYQKRDCNQCCDSEK